MTHRVIVVGIDQSPSARAALQWAAAHARRTGAVLRAVHVHNRTHPRLPYGVGPTSVPPANPQPWGEHERADVAEMFESLKPEPSWTLYLVEDHPGAELVRAAKEAELLVIGTGEHTGVDRLMSGSVSHYCLSHAEVPVVTVPAPQPIRKDRPARDHIRAG